MPVLHHSINGQRQESDDHNQRQPYFMPFSLIFMVFTEKCIILGLQSLQLLNVKCTHWTECPDVENASSFILYGLWNI